MCSCDQGPPRGYPIRCPVVSVRYPSSLTRWGTVLTLAVMTVRVLGALDTGVASLQPRERSIFSALVLRPGHPLSVDELAEAYWGDGPRPTTWPAQVKVSVGRIRARVGKDAVATRGAGYAFGLDPDAVDVVAFERLVSMGRRHLLDGDGDRAADTYRRALALWRGAPFPDLPDWEPAIIEAARLQEIRETAEEELLEARLAAGEHRSVIADAERLVRERPLREGRWALLALAAYRADRQADALSVLREARRRLRDELGVEPGDRLRSLEEMMLRQDPNLIIEAPHPDVSATCPYRGLRSYGPDDAEEFFGRNADVDALVSRVRPGALVVILGPSGAGKSSVLLAGIGPRLVDRGWSLATLRPSIDGFERLAALCEEAVPDAVLIDQAEELTRMPQTDRQAAATTLGRVLDASGAVVMTARSDAVDALIAIPGLGERVRDGLTALGPVPVSALREIVERPAERAGLRLEPGLVELVIRDAGDRYAALPHVSHALAQTWARREGSMMTVAGYQSTGGIAGAVAQTAEDAYLAMSAEQRATCRAVLLRLVERTAEGSVVRVPVSTAPLLADPERRHVIERLVNARLLRVDEGTLTIEHEAIARAWPRLRRWLEEDEVGSRMVGAVSTVAQAWNASGRPDEDLWRGARLQTAVEWRDASSPDLTDVERAFLDASDARHADEVRSIAAAAARDRRQNRRLRVALGGAGMLVAMTVVLGGLAAVRAQEAAQAQSDAQFEALAATAQSTRESDRFGAALLAAALYRQRPSDARAASALFTVLSAPDAPTTTVTFGAAERTFAAAVPGTTEVLAVTGPVGPSAVHARAELWDLSTGELVRRLDAGLASIMTPYRGQVFIDNRAQRAVIVIPAPFPSGQPCCIEHVVAVDLTTGKRTASRDVDARIAVGGGFTPDGRTVVLEDHSGQTPVWMDAATLKTDKPFVASNGADPDPGGIVPLRDGTVAVGLPKRIDIYDSGTHQLVKSFALASDVASSVLAQSGDHQLIGCGPDGTSLIDLATARMRWTRPDADPYPCVSIAVGNDGTYVEQRGTAVEYSTQTGEPTGREFSTASEWITGAGMLGDGSLYVVNQRTTPFITRFAMDGGGPISRLAVPGAAASAGFIDQSSIAVTSGARDAQGQPTSVVWDLRTGRAAGQPASRIVPLGKGIVARWATEASSPRIGDAHGTRTWEFLDTSPDRDIQPGGPGAIAFAIADDSVVAFDAKTGKQKGVPLDFTGKNLWSTWLQIHQIPGTDRAVISWWDRDRADMVTAVFDLTTGKEIAQGLAGDTASIALPGGDVISTNSSEMRRSTTHLVPLRTLAKPTAGADEFEISDDGRILLLAGVAQKASLYDVASGRKLGFDVPTSSPEFTSAHLSPDGRTLITNTRRGVLEWDLDPADMAAAACRMAGRELTAAEWATYFPGESQTPVCAAPTAAGPR